MKENKAAEREEIRLLLGRLGTEEEAQALSSLCALSKGKAGRSAILKEIDHGDLERALLQGAPKARKNAARLMGALGEGRYEAPLLRAFKGEQTRFVRPSILLALGAVGGEEARRALSAAPAPEAAAPQEEKHAAEEGEALRRALLSLSPQGAAHTFSGFDEPRQALLHAPAGFAGVLFRELKGISPPPKGISDDCVQVFTQDAGPLFSARCAMEVLFPVIEGAGDGPGQVARAAQAPFLRFLRGCHSGEGPFRYRVEAGAVLDRAAFVRDLVRELDGPQLINSPSDYEAELRLVPGPKGYDVHAKLFTQKDGRFAYRLRTVPASIHPAMAASIARWLQNHAKQGERGHALDPFCGSGTMLVEWAQLHPKWTLTGVDISGKALSAARQNAKAAGVRAAFVERDVRLFAPKCPQDVILSNLPFGNRVGSHRENTQLYAYLVQNLPDWLANGGVAALYTMEHTLLDGLVQKQRGLSVLGRIQTQAGGLLPHVILVKKN